MSDDELVFGDLIKRMHTESMELFGKPPTELTMPQRRWMSSRERSRQAIANEMSYKQLRLEANELLEGENPSVEDALAEIDDTDFRAKKIFDDLLRSGFPLIWIGVIANTISELVETIEAFQHGSPPPDFD